MHWEQKDKVPQPSVPLASSPLEHTVANIIFPKHCSYPVTFLPENLQSLSISYWIKAKLICQAFKDSHNLAALCLCNLFFHSSGGLCCQTDQSLCPSPYISWSHCTWLTWIFLFTQQNSRADHAVTLSLTFSDHNDHIFLWIPMAKQSST